MASNNNITPLPLKPSRGRKSGQFKKTPRRGMGVAQLELLRQQELWAPHFSSAAANQPVHNFPDRRRLPPVPIFPGPLGHVTGAVSESYCCSVRFKKKRLGNYGIEQAPPVAAGYGHIGARDQEILAKSKSGCVGKNGIDILTQYDFFPEKMTDDDALPQVNGVSDHRSNIATIDLSLRL